jgi:adenylate cyclase
MSAELLLKVEGQEPRKLTLGPVFSIGRGPGNDLVLQDTLASRTHVVIRLQSDKIYYLVDLGSSNGTLLNDRRVTIPLALKSGDRIQIGDSHMEFTTNDVAVAEPVEADDSEDMRTQVQLRTETISILVVDIRNYTSLSEMIPAEKFSRFVGKWFSRAEMIINQHGGQIDKYIGDAVMAIWKKATTKGDVSYVIGPLEAAHELVKVAEEFDKNNDLSCEHPQFHFAVGCGVHTGKAILGNVGQYTAVGDSVNITFRIEALCKQLQRSIILSDEVKKTAGTAFQYEDLGVQQVKGKSQGVHVFALKI